jgi:hypothetical protein
MCAPDAFGIGHDVATRLNESVGNSHGDITAAGHLPAWDENTAGRKWRARSGSIGKPESRKKQWAAERRTHSSNGHRAS